MRRFKAVLSSLTGIALLSLAGGATAAPAGPGVLGVATQPQALSQSDITTVRYRGGGFPVWALGPIPSGFGPEQRTGRPFIAGSRYSYGYHRGYRRYYAPRYRYW